MSLPFATFESYVNTIYRVSRRMLIVNAQAVLKKIQEAGERFHRAFQERLQPFHGQIQDLERQVDEVAAKLDEKRHQFGETIEQNSMAILEKLLEFDVRAPTWPIRGDQSRR